MRSFTLGMRVNLVFFGTVASLRVVRRCALMIKFIKAAVLSAKRDFPAAFSMLFFLLMGTLDYSKLWCHQRPMIDRRRPGSCYGGSGTFLLPLFTELPTRLIVGDSNPPLCRSLRLSVAFSPYLLPAGRIKRSSDKVSRLLAQLLAAYADDE
jgi:hypothetical protein